MRGRNAAARAPASEPRIPGRQVGSVGGPGPILVAVGGLHGNEPSGLKAVRRVLRRLRDEEIPLRGRFVALAGNLGALAQGRRCLGRDLNRLWMEEALSHPGIPADVPERRDLEELNGALENLFADGREVTLVDLHSTSGPSPPFACVRDTRASRAFVRGLPVPLVLGLEEVLRGTLLAWFLDRGGAAGMVFEGGRHRDAATVERAESAVWLSLVSAGLLEARRCPGFARHASRLRAAARGAPRVIEVRHRHPVAPGDGFRMRRGFRGFQPVRKGEPLARDDRGEIHSPLRGFLLFPLYQAQGDDGFFVATRVRSRARRHAAPARGRR